ncbi:MAG: hypothetical protein ACOCZ5_01635 [bacterium]
MESKSLYFNENKHEYIDEDFIKYTSVTQLLSKYYPKFDTKKMAKLCAKSKKGRYNRMNNVRDIMKLWKDETDTALDFGNKEHNYLEDSVKSSTGFKSSGKLDNGSVKLYTISDILYNHNFGIIELNHPKMIELKTNYRRIYNTIVKFAELGYKIYSEIGVYNSYYYVSGLIDILMVKDGEFIILDWKTNKADIIPYSNPKFKGKSGYFRKDSRGNITNDFKFTKEFFFHPINDLETSTYNKYGLQLSTYAYLTSLFGLKHKGNILCHIRRGLYNEYDDIVSKRSEYLGTRVVDIHFMDDFTSHVKLLLEDHYNNTQNLNSLKI